MTDVRIRELRELDALEERVGAILRRLGGPVEAARPTRDYGPEPATSEGELLRGYGLLPPRPVEGS